MNKYTPIPIIDRMSSILDLVLSSTSGVKATDLLKTMEEIPKTTLYRLLSSMVDNNLLSYNEHTGLYTTGLTFLKSQSIAYELRTNLTDISTPILRELVDTFHQTAKISVILGDNIHVVASQESNDPIRITIDPRATFPAHSGASGKVLLAVFSDSLLQQYFQTPRESLTPLTKNTFEAIKPDLDRIRAEGHAIDKGEFNENIHAIAVPVLDNNDNIVAAMSLTYPSVSENTLNEAEMIKALKISAYKIQSALKMNSLKTKTAHYINTNF